MDMLKGFVFFILGLGLLVGIIVFIPILIIWSLNTLFNLMIPYTWQTILATFFLAAIFIPKDVKVRND